MVLSLLRRLDVVVRIARLLERRAGAVLGRGETSAERGEWQMRILEVALSVVPSVAVLTLAWFVVRAISVRVVWREPGNPARAAISARASRSSAPAARASGRRSGAGAGGLRAGTPRTRPDARGAHRGDRGLPRRARPGRARLPRPHAAHGAALGPARHRLRLLHLWHAPLPEPRGGRARARPAAC